MEKIQIEEFEPTNRNISSNPKCNSNQVVEKENECLEWLPDGWNVDFRTRKSGANVGSGYKCYTDPHGKKFYSKLEVLQYLKNIKGTNCISKKEECNIVHSSKKEVEYNSIHSSKNEVECNRMPSSKEENEGNTMHYSKEGECNTINSSKKEGCNTMHSRNNDVIKKSTDEDLPPGWIKEAIARKGGNGKRKDLFYTDPVSGYVFRSKNDVMRYLESGDISSCAIKPKKRQIEDEDRLFPTLAGKMQKPNMSSEMIVASVPTGEPVGPIQSLENEDAYPCSIKKTSDPDDVPEKNHINLMEKAGKKNRSSPAVSKNKKFNVAHRSSPRFAVVEPDQLTNNLTDEQTPQVPKKNLRKGQIEDNKPDNTHDSQGLASEDRLLKENKLLMCETEKHGEITSKSNKSSNMKEWWIPCRASKRLLVGSDPGLVNNSLSHERAPKHKNKKSKGEVNDAFNPCAGESVVEFVGHASMNRGSSSKSRKPSKTNDELEEHKDEEKNDEKSELQQSFAFHYSCSDPSLEFAIQTLTGALPAEDSVGDGPTMISETGKFPENKLFENVKGSSKGKNPRVNSSKSKNKKEHKMPTRLSKRLAGGEPEVQPAERALEYSSRKSFKDKPEAQAILTNEIPGEEESKLITPASDGLKTSKCGESPNCEESLDAQTVPSEHLKRVEAETTNDGRLDTQFSQFRNSWSDPCLEFAIKTLTSSLSVGAADAVSLPITEPDVNGPQRTELVETGVHGNNEAAHNNSNHCHSEEELITVFQPSLLVGQPELRGSSTSYENDPKFATRESGCGESNVTRKLDGEQSLNTEAGNVTQIDINSLFLDEPLRDDISKKFNGGESQNTEAGNVTQIDMNSLFLDEPLRDNTTKKLDGRQSLHTEARNVTQIDINSLFFDEPVRDNTTRKLDEGQSLYTKAGNMTQIDINSLFIDEPLRENEQVLDGESIAMRSLAETETTNQDNSERDSVSFMDAWSDPCLEFAFKTLTGALPEQENKTSQGLQEPANCHCERDGGLAFPEAGSSSVSQRDKSMSGQEASMSSSFLPLENPNPRDTTAVDTQKHYSPANNNKFQW